MFRNKRLLLGCVLGGLVLAALCIGGTLLFVGGSPLYSQWFDKQPVKPAISNKPIFKAMDKFVVTLESDDGLHYLMLELSLVTHDPSQLGIYDSLTPVMRNAVIQLFSKRSRDQVSSDLHQLDKLQGQIADKLRATIQNYGEPAALDDVLITKVVVQ